MGTIATTGKYYGSSINALQLLLFSVGVMLCLNPLFIFSLSFQLSFLATLSLLLFSEPIGRLFRTKNRILSGFASDLSTTLAAQVLVLPLISAKFGTISLLSPIVNMLILWTVPISTILGLILSVFAIFEGWMVDIMAWIVYVPLDIFVTVARLFASLKFCSVEFKLSDTALIIYYVFLFFLILYCRHKRGKTLVLVRPIKKI
jgi:competence protein ComEC